MDEYRMRGNILQEEYDRSRGHVLQMVLMTTQGLKKRHALSSEKWMTISKSRYGQNSRH